MGTEPFGPHLELTGLVAGYASKPVVDGVSLRFDRGVTAIVGRNGAGKTTLLRVVTGVLRPMSGTVRRDDHDVASDPASARRHRQSLGWLPQEAGLPGALTVDQLLAYAAWLKKVPKPDRTVACARAVDACDLGELRDSRLGTLSGGQRRRASLAAAIVNGPSLLILDEPTTGLDPIQRERFLALVGRLGAETCVILSTHLLEDVVGVASRWIAFDSGRVVGEDRISADARDLQAVPARIRAALDQGGRPDHQVEGR